MRYRPLGDATGSVSAVTLQLDAAIAASGQQTIRQLLDAALDEGINSFHIDSLDPTLIRTTGAALSQLDRELLHVALTVGPLPNGRRDFSVEGLKAVLDAVLKATGLQYINTVVLDDPCESELPSLSLKYLEEEPRIRRLGIRGTTPVMDIYIRSGRFEAVFTPCHVQLNSHQRSWLRTAREMHLIVFGTEYYPQQLLSPEPVVTAPPPAKGLFGLPRKRQTAEVPSNPFLFLHTTPGWEAEDLCLANALLDPSLSGVVIRATNVERLQRLARTCERDMPVSLPAQLEMARVAAIRAA